MAPTVEHESTQIFVRVDSSMSLKHIIVSLIIQCTRNFGGLQKRSINGYVDKIDYFELGSI